MYGKLSKALALGFISSLFILPAVHAQNLIVNGDFETGQLSPWFKWPTAAPGIAAVESCCGNQTAGGTWDGYIQPAEQYIELTQKIPVSATPAFGYVTPGHRYTLSAKVSTKNGSLTQLMYYTNVTSDQPCGSTTVVWPVVSILGCTFTVPLGTTKLNVHLTASSGKWELSDDWSLVEAF